MLSCYYTNPFREPNWKWLRATGIANGSQAPATKKRDTPQGAAWIRKAAQFYQRQQTTPSDDSAQLELAEAFPEIYWAHQIAMSTVESTIDDRLLGLKRQLEAYILAKATDEDIGNMCGISPDVVTAYEALFFDVRSRLESSGYVANYVIGPMLHNKRLRADDYGVLWKLYGYLYGPHMVTALVTQSVQPSHCPSSAHVSAAIQEDAIASVKMKAALAAKTVQVNEYTQLSILQILTKFIEIERTTDTANQSSNQLTDHITAMVSCLQFTVGGRIPKGATGSGIVSKDKFHNTAVQLSSEEQLQLVAGQRLPNGDALVALSELDEYGQTKVFSSKAQTVSEQ